MTDVDETSGALEVIPGLWPSPLPHYSEGDGCFSIVPERVPVGDRHAISLRCGDVLLLDRFVPHRSLSAQAGARWAIVMWVKASL
jgi:hypothetical protein